MRIARSIRAALGGRTISTDRTIIALLLCVNRGNIEPLGRREACDARDVRTYGSEALPAERCGVREEEACAAFLSARADRFDGLLFEANMQ